MIKTRTKIYALSTAITLLVVFSLMWVNWKTPESGLFGLDHREIECLNVTVYEPMNGWIDFVVLMEFPFDEGNYSKTPVVPGERLLKLGRNFIWHGSHNIRKKEGISKTVFNIEEFRIENTVNGFYHYYLKCPILDMKLSEKIAEMWRNMAFNETSSDAEYSVISKTHGIPRALACRYVHVYEHGHKSLVYFSVVLPNPHSKDDLEVTKYPMYEKESIILSGNDVYWYGKHDLFNEEGPTKMIFKFTQNLTESHYYEMSCPVLETKFSSVETNYWLIYFLANFWAVIAVVLVPFIAGCWCVFCCIIDEDGLVYYRFHFDYQ